jgi:hypothetical protein
MFPTMGILARAKNGKACTQHIHQANQRLAMRWVAARKMLYPDNSSKRACQRRTANTPCFRMVLPPDPPQRSSGGGLGYSQVNKYNAPA